MPIFHASDLSVLIRLEQALQLYEIEYFVRNKFSLESNFVPNHQITERCFIAILRRDFIRVMDNFYQSPFHHLLITPSINNLTLENLELQRSLNSSPNEIAIHLFKLSSLFEVTLFYSLKNVVEYWHTIKTLVQQNNYRISHAVKIHFEQCCISNFDYTLESLGFFIEIANELNLEKFKQHLIQIDLSSKNILFQKAFRKYLSELY